MAQTMRQRTELPREGQGAAEDRETFSGPVVWLFIMVAVVCDVIAYCAPRL
jgi:hypothetical protein